MEEEKKPFDVVSIVLLVLLALINDGLLIFFDLLAATVVGLPGEAIMEPINLVMSGIITAWFFMKCGFGGPAIVQVADSLLSLVGVPGRTICVVVGIYIANHPKLAAVAEMAGAAAVTGGAGAVAAEAGEAAEVGTVAAQGATAAAEGATAGVEAAQTETTIETGASGTQKAVEQTSKKGEAASAGEEGEATEKKEELEKEMETEAERSPEEVAQEEIFEHIPKNQEEQSEEESENEEADQNNQPPVFAPVDEVKKASEIKQQQQKLHAPKIIDLREGDKAA